jgi:uncharacterized protein YidB (DUF937 family)
MDIKSLATQLLMSKIGGANDPAKAESALSDLIGGGESFDLGAVVGKFSGAGGDIAEKAKSWLGDGGNESIDASQVQDALGAEKIEAFAAKLGVDRDEASNGLSQILPQLIDKSSQGGALLESVGGFGGLAGLASKFLK